MKIATKIISIFILTVFPSIHAAAQNVPESAHVNLYFPHLAQGGPPENEWIAKISLTNPTNSDATVRLFFFANDGSSMEIDFGNGRQSTLTVPLAAGNSVSFKSLDISDEVSYGWAYGFADTPVMAHIRLTHVQGGRSRTALMVEAVLPSTRHLYQVSASAGVSIANFYSDTSIDVRATLYDSATQDVRSEVVTLSPAGHIVITVDQLYPNADSDFHGIVVTGPSAVAGRLNDGFNTDADDIREHVAWAFEADTDGVLTGLPRGRISFPASHRDEIWLTFHHLLKTAHVFQSRIPLDLDLNIVTDRNVNAYARHGNEIGITMGLAELVGDSPSELAFVIGHEIGHIYQQITGRREFDFGNKEHDADVWGATLSILAGYDPYGAAGALAKLTMATGRASLSQQFFEDVPVADAHQSMNTRLSSLFDQLTIMCSVVSEFCETYKKLIHPHLPDISPLGSTDVKKK